MWTTAKRGIAAALLTASLAAAAWAADATGKWTWTVRFNDQEFKSTMELKQEGEKLTGTVTGRNGSKTEIKEGTVKGSDLAFHVIREFNGNEVKIRYKGKVEGDTIKGMTIFSRDGEERTIDWTAMREK